MERVREERLEKVAKLTRMGYPLNALNERMSVNREQETLRAHGYDDTNPDYNWDESYARQHLLRDLAGLVAKGVANRSSGLFSSRCSRY